MGNELNPGFEKLPLRYAYPFLEENGLKVEGQVIRSSQRENSIKRAEVAALLKRKELLDQFVKEYWPRGADDDQRGVKKLLRTYDRWIQASGETSEDYEPDDDEAGTEFIYEQHLRDYLEANVQILETGMTLWPDENAIEYPVDTKNHRIDILAKDKDGVPTVIELKVSRGHERTIGQSLYYRARVKEILKASKVRIVIVAAEISPELRAAATEVSDVALFEYCLSMSVKKV